jgi:hypothetical protein
MRDVLMLIDAVPYAEPLSGSPPLRPSSARHSLRSGR